MCIHSPSINSFFALNRCLQLLAEVNSDLGRSDEAMANVLEDFDLCRKHHMPLHKTSLLFNRLLVSKLCISYQCSMYSAL